MSNLLRYSNAQAIWIRELHTNTVTPVVTKCSRRLYTSNGHEPKDTVNPQESIRRVRSGVKPPSSTIEMRSTTIEEALRHTKRPKLGIRFLSFVPTSLCSSLRNPTTTQGSIEVPAFNLDNSYRDMANRTRSCSIPEATQQCQPAEVVPKADCTGTVREVCSVATVGSSSVLINMVSRTDPLL
jgi:hypothetical protein